MKNRLITVNVARIRKIVPYDGNSKDKYFLSGETNFDHKIDEISLADALDKKVEDPLENQIVFGPFFDETSKLETQGEGNIDIDDQTKASKENINPDPETIDIPDVSRPDIPDTDLDTPLEPRRAKLDALSRLTKRFNDILSYLY